MRNIEAERQGVRLESWVTSKYPYHNSHVLDKERNERKVSRDLSRVESLVEINDPKERIKEFALHMQKPDAAGFVVANHDQHVNVSGFLKVAKQMNELSERPLNHHLVVTLSLINGDQGVELQRLALGMKPMLVAENMSMIAIMREKDRKDFYGEGKRPNGEDKKTEEELKRDNRLSSTNAHFLSGKLIEGDVIWIFPAGTTTEGVVDLKNGVAPGMNKIKIKTLALFMRVAKLKKKDLKVMSLSLNGFNTIVPAREKKGTPEAKKAMIRNLTIGKMKGYVHMAEVVPGELYGVAEIESQGINLKNHEEVNDFVLGHVAENVDPNRRGEFA